MKLVWLFSLKSKKLPRSCWFQIIFCFVLLSGCSCSAKEESQPDPNDASVLDVTAESIYKDNCFTCHGTGLPGAPQTGSAGEWAPRLTGGKATLYKHALEGFLGDSGILMPPKGGNSNLTDDEVRLVVDYMLRKANLE